MLKWIAFLCSLLLALNLGTIAEVLRADVPDQDGSESDVIAKPVAIWRDASVEQWCQQ